MKATLPLDDDVAALLDRAQRERGGSVKQLGNELLRRTLRRERESELMQTAGFQASRQAPAASLEAQIGQLYDEIRDLVARSQESPELQASIEQKEKQLLALQSAEAKAWLQQAQARRHLRPGEGYRLLDRAAKLLES